MHPFQSEIYARTEVEARRRDAEQRRLLRSVRSPWSTGAGALLVAAGDGIRQAGERLQRMGRAEGGCPTPCLDGR